MPPPSERPARAARYLAPAAFLAAVTVAVLLVHSGLRGGSDGTATTTRAPATHPAATTRSRAKTQRTVKRYTTVASGDTFGSIAAREGISVQRLEQLNPGVSSNALRVGQRLRVK